LALGGAEAAGEEDWAARAAAIPAAARRIGAIRVKKVFRIVLRRTADGEMNNADFPQSGQKPRPQLPSPLNTDLFL
jgi:hypothetical protein